MSGTRIAVFGSTGATGRLLIERALAAGNEVVAFARSPQRISQVHERLTVIAGTLADTAAIERAVRGVDAVISVLSPPPREPDRKAAFTGDTKHHRCHGRGRNAKAGHLLNTERFRSERPP